MIMACILTQNEANQEMESLKIMPPCLLKGNETFIVVRKWQDLPVELAGSVVLVWLLV